MAQQAGANRNPIKPLGSEGQTDFCQGAANRRKRPQNTLGKVRDQEVGGSNPLAPTNSLSITDTSLISQIECQKSESGCAVGGSPGRYSGDLSAADVRATWSERYGAALFIAARDTLWRVAAFRRSPQRKRPTRYAFLRDSSVWNRCKRKPCSHSSWSEVSGSTRAARRAGAQAATTVMSNSSSGMARKIRGSTCSNANSEAAEVIRGQT